MEKVDHLDHASEPTEAVNPDPIIFRHEYIELADKVKLEDGIEKALPLYRAALEKFENENIETGKIVVWNNLAEYFIDNYQYDTASFYLENAYSLGLSQADTLTLTFANTKFLLGVLNDFGGHPFEAIKYHQESLEIKKILYQDDSPDIAKGLYRLGDAYHYGLDNYKSAIENYLKAAVMREKFPEVQTKDLVINYYALGSASRQIDETENAIIYINKAIDYAKNDSIALADRFGLCYNLLANIYNDLQQFDEAINYYKLAINVASSDPHMGIVRMPTYYNGLGVAFNGKKDVINGYHSLHKSYKILETSKSDNHNEIANVLINLGATNAKLNRPDSAEFYYQKGLNHSSKYVGPSAKGVVQAYKYLGNLYQDKNDHMKAANYFQMALNASDTFFLKNNPYQNPVFSERFKSYDLFENLNKKASALKKIYDHTNNKEALLAAMNSYLLADQMLDLKRNSDIKESSLISFTKNFVGNRMEEGIDCAYTLYKMTSDKKYLELGFMLIEKTKYMILLDAVVKQNSFNDYGIPKEIIDEDNSLRVEMIYYKNQLLRDVNEEEKAAIQDKIYDISIRQKALIDTIKINFPRFYKVKYDSISISLDKLQNDLVKKQNHVIQYYVGTNHLFIFSIKPDDIIFDKVEKPVTFDQDVNTFIAQITKNSIPTDQESFKDYSTSAKSLYDVLLKNYIEINTDSIGKKSLNLTLIPHGILSMIPFEPLIVALPQNDRVNYKDLNYLLKYANISYAYSANILSQNSIQKELTNNPSMLAFSYSDQGQKETEKNEIAGTSRELLLISSFVDVKMYQGLQASEQNFKKIATDYDIIHLAVHGAMDTSIVTHNSLIFKEGADSVEDGTLHDYELYNLNLKARLVVLSACETGIGKRIVGEGIFSMARGFAYAGCPSIVMSYWKANDKLTAEIMGAFYQSLSSGSAMDAALRTAKIDYISRSEEFSAHPSNWAAFVALGDMKDPIYIQKPAFIPLWGYALIVLVLMVVLFGWIRLRSN